MEPLLYLCVAGAGGVGNAVPEDGVSPWLGSALRGLRAQLRGAVRPSVLGHRRMGLRPVLVGKRHPLRSAPLRRKLRHGAGAVPALQTGADPSDAHINEERRPIGRRSLFIACTPHTALGRRAS